MTNTYERPYTYASAGPIRKLFRMVPAVWPLGWFLAKTSYRIDRAAYGITGGRLTVLGFFTGLPIVMLTTTGAKTGRQVTIPVIAVPDGERLIVVASNYGRRHHPAWYHNLIADQHATLAVAGSEMRMVARLVEPAERQRLWALDSKTFPVRDALQRRAGDRDFAIFAFRAR